MLISREPDVEEKIQFRIRMHDTVYQEINAYCEWAGIRYRDYFIEEACKYIFANSTQWKAFKEQQTKK